MARLTEDERQTMFAAGEIMQRMAESEPLARAEQYL
jgi:hypothetical protein